MNQVCDLIQHWRKTCGAHENCVPEYDALLPTRILALCGDDARPLVKLIVSKGRKGRYLALSHCWGSSERPPLRTTSENFQSHQNGIPFGDMPKTFQDVVEIAQGIGIKYIWIDSICIIQGNSQDWHSEAAKMGDVYRNAALVVAASGAKDSSRGLFITDRPAETVFRLPYRVAGEIKGTFNMIPLSTVTDWHPEFGPLQRRAWTLQERHLARRFVSFMPGGISWICQTASITETGTPFRGFPSRREWFHLLSDYTGKSLTFPSDRIEAIRGIAQDIQSSRKDQYISKYGVWEEGLVDQLLWFKEEIYFEDGRSFNMPSWCWANTETRKRWPQESRDPFYTGLGKTIEMPKEIEIDSAGHLSITGHLNTTQPALGNVRYEFNSNRGGMFYDLCISSFMITDVYILSQDLASSYDKTVLGVGKFDNSGTTSYTHAWLLLKEPKIPEIQGATAELSTEEFCLVRDHCTTLAPNTNVYQNDVVYHTERNPEFAYWALLLEKVNESSYRRVGIAILFPTAYEALQVDVQEFTVV
jgi:hypothetical protein